MLNERDIQALNTIIQKVNGMRGVGRIRVTNTPSGIVIDLLPEQQVRNPAGAPASPVIKFGKATADSTGNAVTVAPCVSETDGTSNGEANVTLRIYTPQASQSPPNAMILQNQIVAYIPTGSTGYVLTVMIPKGSSQYQVFQMTTSTTWGWDFPRGHS